MELAESAAEMGVSITGSWTGWGRCVDVENFLHRGGSGGVSLRVGVVGHVPTDWEGTGQHSPSGDAVAEGADTTYKLIWHVDIPSPENLEMAEANLQKIENYATHLQETFAKNISTRQIMDLCLAACWRPGSRFQRDIARIIISISRVSRSFHGDRIQ